MNPERWREVKTVLEAALAMEFQKRQDYLDRVCSLDQSLRREVESLLAADEQARSSFLESPSLAIRLEKGARLADYEIRGLLGSGGMGEVYRARDLRLHRDVAIKVLPAFVSSDPERLRRFEQEAQAAAALNHPNILAVFQLGTYAGAPYLVSELLEGDTLRRQIARGPMAVGRAIDYGVQIAHGLSAAHEKGVVHRDLKPENLFATKDGHIKILDFGLAKLTQPEQGRQHNNAPTLGRVATEPGMVMGTVGYMSPEQVRGKDVDHRTDMFAFGAILYEMLTGKRAFQKTTSVDTMSAILNEEPPPVSQVVANIPPALQRTTNRCLEKSPERRFQSASDLAFALEALSDSTAPSLSAVTVHPPASLTWRPIVLITLAVAIVAALLFWWRVPTQVPVVEGVTQLTDDGERKGNLVTDGLRIYFEEDQLAQVSVTGGQAAILPGKPGFGILAITPDFSGLLVNNPNENGKFGLMPIPGGEPRPLDLRINGISTGDFFPDGRIIWSFSHTLFVAEKDGSNPRQLTNLPGMAWEPHVSPDGKRVRLTVIDDRLHYSTWEVASNGTGLHKLLTAWPGSLGESGNGWTPDGKYFLFQTQGGGRSDLWLLPEQRPFLDRAISPIRLTHGPISYDTPKPSPDGKKLFAVGSKNRGELVRYDARTRQLVPYLSGMSAISAMASQDGKWIIYVTYPDHALWRSNADGSGRIQLTFPPMMVFYPQISPNGTQIAFSGLTEAGLGLYILETESRKMEKLADFGHAPTWSPDGNSLAFTAIVAGKHFWDEAPWCEIETIDLRTKRISVVADPSGNRISPWWPTPNQIVAFGVEDNGAHLYDFKTGQWSSVGKVNSFAAWTPALDRKSLYMLADTANGQAVVRMRLPDFKVETIASLPGVRLTQENTLDPISSGQWIGVAADGSVTLTRDVGSSEIYALDVKWP